MKRKQRQTDEFNVSFLDVICCGFGAIVLLLMITKTVPIVVLEETQIDREGQVADLQRALFEIRGETTILNRDLNAKHEQLDSETERIAILRGKLTELEARYASLARQASSDDSELGKLARATQSLTEEMQRLLGNQFARQNNIIGGIPVDSEYIIFIIDTSGSMFNFAWPRMMDEMIAILDIYPSVKGIQVMNDMGQYMFTSLRDEWITDSPTRRTAIINRLRNWNPFSNSSPVEGIQKAVRTFYDPGKRVSIYVMGDDFTGRSIGQVVDIVDRLNHNSANNKPRVRIHAVGFPVQFDPRVPNRQGVYRFAALMRELTYRNGGTFVGLNDYKRQR
ncbi:VWA domain-containing protein [Simiduia sp. 21SJ11W-1]|uniref:vWA domain-containing protein n=1 Tax=Simiduia sp. 21SJ11W-1 TaxID=2909669 RepID=UPI0020A014F1|nr:VWA domain-containing protein [Simiduia sp. 21SJ11W-1]UTA46653.1 VWA domain-containing protein [Simiduia sp. 21SJ11W-1]